MKKVLLVLLILVVFSFTCAAKSSVLDVFVGYGKSLKEINESPKTIKNIDTALSEKEDLSNLEKYNSLKQKAFGPSMLNLSIGFGTGSKMVGDKLGYSIGYFADMASFGVLGVAGAIWLTDALIAGISTLGQKWSTDSELVDIARITALVGAGMLAVSHIVQAILPPIYTARYNKTLREALGLSKADIKMAILPSDNFGITAVASIQY